MKPILRVENLSKQYKIGKREAPYATLRESLTNAASAPFRRAASLANRTASALRKPLTTHHSPLTPDQPDTIWALKDINFEVQPGEVVGIIGRNGAGKSTLLKILSRITEPTTGKIDLYGRVGSLLEVGTGFHPELTGRENIFLNGAILGMKRQEILRKFDDIVAFAELETFIDTPVKRFSSGMYLRLAFAVAAHLDPDILVIDEVLAVGDAAFQKACLGKMKEVAEQGRTILFVSHNMSSVKSLCSRAIQLRNGCVKQDGGTPEVVAHYLRENTVGMTSERVWHSLVERPGNHWFQLTSVRVLNVRREIAPSCSSSEPIIIELQFELKQHNSALVVAFDLITRDGVVVFKSAHNDRHERNWPTLNIGHNSFECHIPANLLSRGTYFVAPKIYLHGIGWIVNAEPEVNFDVLLDHGESPFWNEDSSQKFNGVIAPCLDWTSVNV